MDKHELWASIVIEAFRQSKSTEEAIKRANEVVAAYDKVK